MFWIVLHVSLALWVAIDGFSRRMGLAAIAWAIGVLFLFPLAIPVYLARRSLKNGEVRRGGAVWNVLKNLAVTWTFYCIFVLVYFLGFIEKYPQFKDDVNGALFEWLLIWILPTIGAVLIGLYLRDETAIEEA